LSLFREALSYVLRYVDISGTSRFDKTSHTEAIFTGGRSLRKYFGFTEDGTSVIGIYLWTSKESVDEFYSPEWIAGVTQRWGTTPVKDEWVVPVVAESTEGKVVSEGSHY
jgi:hypothetical protein